MDFKLDFELDELELDPMISLTVERDMWLAVIILTLEDLDVICRHLYEQICPVQTRLILDSLTKDVKGRDYWVNRTYRKQLISDKAICKVELYKLLDSLQSKWFENICDFAGVRHDLIKTIYTKIIKRELNTRLSKSNLKFNLRLKSGRVMRRKPRRLLSD